MIIAVVGSGGKTTRIHKLAEDYRKKGKKVLVTTTTHMFAEEDCELSGNVERIIKKLEDCGYCMAGLPAEGGKMKSLDEETYEKICQFAEVVLVEADGSKGLPVKFPSEREPVIPKNAEEIHIVTGVSAIPQASFANVFPVHGATIKASSSFFGPIGSTSSMDCRGALPQIWAA